MNQIATVTSKMQLTLPVVIYKKAGIKKGQKVLVSEENGKIIITPARRLVEELAGSLSLPEKWKGKGIEQVIETAKSDYFKKHSK